MENDIDQRLKEEIESLNEQLEANRIEAEELKKEQEIHREAITLASTLNARIEKNKDERERIEKAHDQVCFQIRGKLLS